MSKISILCANLSSNALGRAYLLGQVLQRRYEVEILGPVFGEGIWPPCDTGEFAYKAVKGCDFPGFLLPMRDLLRRIEGDAIYAVKPRPASFGLGLLARLRSRVPLVLDIDDWDLAKEYLHSRRRRLLRLVCSLRDPYANHYLLLAERLIPQADAITIVSRALKQRFGGVLVPHGRDTNHLDPARYCGESLRRAWGLSEHKVIMFVGTPRPHKGLEDLLDAMTHLADLPLMLVVVGVDRSDPYTERLTALGGDRVCLLGMQPISEVPRFLAAADLVVLPQRKDMFTQAQVPAKVFDAMAMARPIIATAVGDLPQILEGCGLVVPAGDVFALGRAIRRLAVDPGLAQELGRQARRRCIERYSWAVIERILHDLFSHVLARHSESRQDM